MVDYSKIALFEQMKRHSEIPLTSLASNFQFDLWNTLADTTRVSVLFPDITQGFIGYVFLEDEYRLLGAVNIPKAHLATRFLLRAIDTPSPYFKDSCCKDINKTLVSYSSQETASNWGVPIHKVPTPEFEEVQSWLKVALSSFAPPKSNMNATGLTVKANQAYYLRTAIIPFENSSFANKTWGSYNEIPVLACKKDGTPMSWLKIERGHFFRLKSPKMVSSRSAFFPNPNIEEYTKAYLTRLFDSRALNL